MAVLGWVHGFSRTCHDARERTTPRRPRPPAHALAAHLSAELNIQEDDIVSPWNAALASAVAFTLGAILPMLAILLPPPGLRVPLTFAAVLLALAVTGAVGAWIGGASRFRAAARVVLGGALALAATFSIGSLLGASGVF